MAPRSNRSPLIVIVGQTASGKSSMAVKLAQKYSGEIVCADSRTIYRSMDTGTAKPTKKEQDGIRHHLMDIVAPGAPFNASMFKELAGRAIRDIQSRGKTAFLVGGSGLYVDSVVFDYEFSPTMHDDKKRQDLNKKSISGLQDIIRSKKIKMPTNQKNKRHLIRAIETDGVTPANREARPDTLILGIRLPSDELKDKITKRTHQMINKDGLVEETRALAEKYGWQCEPMKSIGYREWRGYFAGEKTKDQVSQQIISSTLRFAKRQATWYKRNKNIVWVKDLQTADELIGAFVSRFDTIKPNED